MFCVVCTVPLQIGILLVCVLPICVLSGGPFCLLPVPPSALLLSAPLSLSLHFSVFQFPSMHCTYSHLSFTLPFSLTIIYHLSLHYSIKFTSPVLSSLCSLLDLVSSVDSVFSDRCRCYIALYIFFVFDFLISGQV